MGYFATSRLKIIGTVVGYSLQADTRTSNRQV